MVEALKEWMTSIVLVSLLLSVAQTLIPEGSIRKISAFTGGLILLAALLQPILEVDLRGLELGLGEYEQAIQERQGELEETGRSELSDIIAGRTAAYISDKAEALGISVAVEVIVETEETGVPVPVAAKLGGPWSEELASYMEQELGIPRERQVWKDEEAT